MEEDDLWRSVESSGVAGMSFLFNKIDAKFFEIPEGKPSSLVDFCLEQCLSSTLAMDNPFVILLSATLKRIITLIRDAKRPLSVETSTRVFDYIVKRWDWAIDVVCYECCDVFGMLLDIHSNHCGSCGQRSMCSFAEDVCRQLFNSPSTCRSLFKCINAVLKNFPGIKHLDDGFVRRLYDHLQNPSLSVVISEIIINELYYNADNVALHRDCLLKCVVCPLVPLRSAVKDRLIPMLMKNPQNREFVADLLSHIQMGEGLDQEVQLDAMLSIARILVNNCGAKTWNDFVAKETLGCAILHNNLQVRLAAWSLLCIHPRATVPYSSSDLPLMKAFLVSNASEQSPAARQKILASFKQILVRMAESSNPIIKGKAEDNGIVEEYEEFIQFVVNLAFDSLSTGANFNRRVFSLSVIDHIFRQNHLSSNGKCGFLKRLRLPSLLTEARFHLLLACLDDSFQLCQILSLDLLKSLEFQGEFNVDVFYQESLEIVTSIRSHDTLSAGYRFQFVASKQPTRLSSILSDFVLTCDGLTSLAENDLMSVTTKPIHPILNAITSLMTYATSFDEEKTFWSSFCCEKLLPLCFRVAALVMPVVHSMAPEGYIPEDKVCQLAGGSSGSLTQLHADVSQLLLACCWRAHKHVSEMLDWSVRTLFPLGLLPASFVHRIGEYFWLQLTECRHCGAFESAVEGFTSLCAFLWKRADPALPQPMDWLDRIMGALSGGEDLDKLCSTRRSAGVPHLVVAILSTEPSNVALNKAAPCLLQMEDKQLKFRIHSLNVLKAIFHSSALSERVAFALEAACRVAVSGCSAASWSERNSSAQLAAALRTHIFGVTRSSQRDLAVDPKNRQSAHEFFSRFPSLYPFLYQQLEIVRDEFSLYPTLIFLTHLFPTSTVSQFHLAPFIPLCLRCLLWIKSEKLRKLCAAAIVAISQREDIDFILGWIEGQESVNLKQNHLHGVLLILSSILQTPSLGDNTPRVSAILETLMGDAFSDMCDYNKNITLELCNKLEYNVVIQETPLNTELTKRQLALLWLKNGDIHQFDDLRLRLEVYRWLDLAEGSLPLADSSPISSASVIASAVKDLDNCHLESDAACIMRVFIEYLDLVDVAAKAGLALVVTSKLDGWVMPATIAAASRLCYLLGEMKSSEDVVQWVESTQDLEDDYPKLQAIDICCGLAAKEPSPAILRTLSAFLKDEDACIRDECAKKLSSSVLHRPIPLCAEVCRYLLEKKLEPTGVLKEDATPIEAGLFDACAANVFAESRLFGDLSVVDPFVQ